MGDKKIEIYVITTGNDARLERVSQILHGFDLNFVFSEDFDVLSEKEKFYKKSSHRFRQKAIMAGEIGAFMTHSFAWERVVRSGKPAIIIEDNIDFIKPPSSLFSAEVIETVARCGVVSFTDFSYKISHEDPFLISDVPQKKPLPIVCYGVTPERAETFLKAMKKHPYVLPVDKWMSVPRLCGCSCFVSPDSIAKRARGVTSIANKRKGERTLNPVNMLFWVINKSRYGY